MALSIDDSVCRPVHMRRSYHFVIKPPSNGI